MKAKILFVVEALVIATVFHLDYLGLLPVSKTPYLFLLGWISIRLRGLRWKAVGLTVNQPFLRLLAIGLAVGIAMVLIMRWRPRGLVTTREPSIFLKEKKAVSSDLVAQGHG